MFVYVIRHGESETNRAKKWTGWLDVPLTEKGKEDANKAGGFLKHISFDKIYSSDLCRAAQTAQAAIPGCCCETLPMLREIDMGTLANQPISILTDDQRVYASKFGYAEFGGETREQFYSRISQVMNMLETQNWGTVALFSHGGWLRGMLDLVVDVRLPREHVCCHNCTIAVFEYTGEIWRLHSWINPA